VAGDRDSVEHLGRDLAFADVRCGEFPADRHAVAGINRLNLQGNAEQQAAVVRQAMSTLFPEAVTLVREAREGFGT
jgi:hypothetical protein